jgi:hypothetical protein
MKIMVVLVVGVVEATAVELLVQEAMEANTEVEVEVAEEERHSEREVVVDKESVW